MPQPKFKTIESGKLGLGYAAAKNVRDYTRQHGGGTFTISGLPVNPKHGFALSLNPERTKIIPEDAFTPTTVELFFTNNQPYCIDHNQSDREGFKFIGTWVHEGYVHMDVSTVLVTKDIEKVMRLAREHNQLAVYDFATKKTLDVS